MNSSIHIAGGIEFGPETVREVGEGASEAQVAISSIVRCRFAYGSIAKHPKSQATIGVVLASGILIAGFLFLSVLIAGRKLGWYLEASLIVFSWVGIWLIRDALRKVHHVEVTTTDGIHKLRLVGEMNEKELETIRIAAARGSNLVL